MSPEEVPPKAVRDYFSKIGKKYGALGGQTTAKKLTAAQRQRNAKKASEAAHEAMTPEQRKERARKAAAKRWKKKKP